MQYMDEKIAMTLKRERMKKHHIEKEQEEKVLADSIDEEKVKEGILAGKCGVLDHQYEFAEYEACEGRFHILLPKKGLVVTKDIDTVFQASSDELGFSCTISATTNQDDVLSMADYRKKIEKGLSQFQYKWVEEGVQMVDDYKISYIDYVMLTGMMKLHNQMWFFKDKHGFCECVLNYDEEEKLYFKPMIKGVRETFSFGKKSM